MIESKNETIVTVEYEVFKESCERCGSDLDDNEPIRDGEFDSPVKNIIEYFGWSTLAPEDIYPDFDDELREGIWEHFYNAINFFCLNFEEDIKISDHSLEQAYQIVKLEVDKLRKEELA